MILHETCNQRSPARSSFAAAQTHKMNDERNDAPVLVKFEISQSCQTLGPAGMGPTALEFEFKMAHTFPFPG